MATEKQKIKAFEIAVSITKEAARGGYSKIALNDVLEEVYRKTLELIQETQSGE